MRFPQVAFLAVVLVFTTHAEDAAPVLDAEATAQVARLRAAEKLPVPEPPSTPYDSDSKARQVYLEEYRFGYRSILAAVDIDCHMGILGPTFQAYQEGWHDGRQAARKAHPEKVAEMIGVPLEIYLQTLK